MTENTKDKIGFIFWIAVLIIFLSVVGCTSGTEPEDRKCTEYQGVNDGKYPEHRSLNVRICI